MTFHEYLKNLETCYALLFLRRSGPEEAPLCVLGTIIVHDDFVLIRDVDNKECAYLCTEIVGVARMSAEEYELAKAETEALEE